jgi:hypothetical protein
LSSLRCGGPPRQQPPQVGPHEAPPAEEHPRQLFAIAEMSLSMPVEPHAGQATFWDELMTSSSKSRPHALHSYSKMGIAPTSFSRLRDHVHRASRASRPREPRARTGPRSRRSDSFKWTRRDGGEETS